MTTTTAKAAAAAGAAKAAAACPQTLAEALTAFQRELPTIAKDKDGVHNSKYAPLEKITEKVVPLLAKAGVAWSCTPDIVEGVGFVLRCRLAFRDEVLEGVYPIQAGSPQTVGGAITYARRYALCAMTGVAPGGDDDDAAAAEAAWQGRAQHAQRSTQTQRKARNFTQTPASAEQRATVQEWADQLGLTPDQLDRTVGYVTDHQAEDLNSMTGIQVPAVVAYLKKRLEDAREQAENRQKERQTVLGGDAA